MHQVDDDAARAPFCIAGGDPAWTLEAERAPMLYGTRLHWIADAGLIRTGVKPGWARGRKKPRKGIDQQSNLVPVKA